MTSRFATSFTEAVSAARGRPLVVDRELAATLARIEAAARAAWPEVTVDVTELATTLAEGLPIDREPAPWLDAIHASDLYLVVACQHGDRAALAAFERVFMPQIADYLGRDRDSLVDEVGQILRERLFVAEPGRRARIASYFGRGPLGAWLRVIAQRTALNVRRAREASDRAELRGGACATPALDPELDLLKARYRPLFRDAVEASIRSLPAKRRNMLRLYFLDDLTLAQIGALFRLHESSIARQLAATRQHVLEHTRRELVERHGLAPSEAESIIHLVGSRADLGLSSVLAHITET